MYSLKDKKSNNDIKKNKRKQKQQNQIDLQIFQILINQHFNKLTQILITKMPNLKIQQDRFDQLMGKKYSFEQLDQLGFQFGIQVQQAIQQNAQSQKKAYYKFDCMNNRPDLLTEATLVRTFKIYLEQIQTPQLTLTKPQWSITVDSSVKQIRPFIVGAVLRNIKFDDKTYKAFISAQQKLHATFCRDRKYASIGTHDLDSIQGPFKYVARDPTSFQFIPLNQQKKVNGLGMMQLLQTHKLKQYLHLIRQSPVYPLVLDSQDRVLSVPPIINSDHSKISINTKNVFIQVTALSRPKAMTCLNTLIWSFSQYCQIPFQVQPVQIIHGQQRFITPQVQKKQFIIQHSRAQTLVGATLTSEQIVHFLKKTGLQAIPIQNNSYRILVPCWRGDVIHECDILQDIAICYGYTKIVPVLPPASTVGARLRLNKFTDLLRHQMAQGQFNQVLNFALCSKADLTTNVLNNDDSKLITISNAKTKEFQTGRTTLLPGLLRTILENKSSPLPLKLFEAGDCIIINHDSDTGSSNLRKLAAVMTDQILEGHKKQIFSVVHGALDLVMKKCSFEFKRDYILVPGKNQFFFAGQQFQVILKGEKVGQLGVVNPKVLKNFGWLNPTSMWQLDIEILEKHFTAAFK